ncbi:MMPL domain protein [Beutenbergia cavernae DSM 12333]|uniref:MMPL domain protein n=1 Tax=Beutenbergia cavernae (strain ATCC BAA-8 / DSM 12333 / CCUG 43141 / JCM 11478 / NBRC 16432 / NCIMB 13614 / HKI 0122) TaxID=471853 RepID=C5C042_BEUC1|nr:MMPL domain protein [Beutenbergia cavernae DSM 12333]
MEEDLSGTADELRTTASDGVPEGVDVYLTGAVGFQDDITNAFAGADVRLLVITASIVALLLIVTYRSPVLWLVPLAVVGTADGIARVGAVAAAEALGFIVDASIGGILSVLVFGAGTNYALLLVARYREELHRTDDRFEAMGVAVRRAGPAILASGSTVILSLLALMLADLGGTRALGVTCAIGIAVAMLFALTVLPAALVVCGRGLFWPFVPRVVDGADEKGGVWDRIARSVARRPALVATVAGLGVAVLGLGLVGSSVGLSQTQQLVGDPESVQGQEVIEENFSPGTTSRTTVLAPDAAADDALAVAESVPGVIDPAPGESADGWTQITLAVDAAPQSDEAFAVITDLREAYAGAPEPTSDSLVGGPDATALDTTTTAERDQRTVIPVIFGIVFLILVVLLRALVAPVLLIATVLLTYVGSMGLGSLVFRYVLDIPAFDTTVVLYAFLFLVALGVDYNIFLVTRAREEARASGTREGMIRAVSSTGGVITSAGILLAAVFAVLGVLPVIALLQIGIIVCVGVLLDTLVVRTLLVPALAGVLGERFWWPGRVGERGSGREGRVGAHAMAEGSAGR